MQDETEQVVLVDLNDREVGVSGKLEAHRDGGVLHRAFSVFVQNAAGSLLLQRRALAKYHFPGLWSNSCCGHSRPGELLLPAAKRRLTEEMGITVTLREIGLLRYTATDAGTGLVEREIDHLVIGLCDETPRPDPEEVVEWRWAGPEELWDEVTSHPHRHTPWFVAALRGHAAQRAVLDMPRISGRRPIGSVSNRAWTLLEAESLTRDENA